MENTEERRLIGPIRRTALIIVSVLIFLIVLIFTYIQMAPSKEQEVAELEGWYYLENDQKVPVHLPVTVSCSDEGAFVLYNDSLTGVDAGKVLTTKGAQYGLSIALDGEVLYAYEDELFPRNNQMKAKQDCDAAIPAAADGQLMLTCDTPLRGKVRIEKVFIGSGSKIMLYHFRQAIPTFMISFLFTILGVIAVGAAAYLHACAIDCKRFVDTAFFLIICSIWFVTDSPLVQQHRGIAPLVCTVSFFAFMFLAIPMIYFVKNIADMKKYRSLDVLILLFYGNAFLQGFLHLLLGVEFIEMLFVTHILLVGGVGFITTLLVKESIYRGNRDVYMISAAFLSVAGSGIFALLLYWLLEIPYYGSIFEGGILIFITLVLVNIIISMVENIHYRTEMLVYQRMAKQDWMTGLENRQPFDELIHALQRERYREKNVGLIFLDVNHLKQTNDEFGHEAGDAVIIGAARCIQAVFGEEGHCYRIGGDEFGVIVPDSDKTPEEWFALLDMQLEKYNRDSRYRVSVARGWSWLYQEDGVKKSISEWKSEADYEMYRDKNGGQRR